MFDKYGEKLDHASNINKNSHVSQNHLQSRGVDPLSSAGSMPNSCINCPAASARYAWPYCGGTSCWEFTVTVALWLPQKHQQHGTNQYLNSRISHIFGLENCNICSWQLWSCEAIFASIFWHFTKLRKKLAATVQVFHSFPEFKNMPCRMVRNQCIKNRNESISTFETSTTSMNRKMGCLSPSSHWKKYCIAWKTRNMLIQKCRKSTKEWKIELCSIQHSEKINKNMFSTTLQNKLAKDFQYFAFRISTQWPVESAMHSQHSRLGPKPPPGTKLWWHEELMIYKYIYIYNYTYWQPIDIFKLSNQKINL